MTYAELLAAYPEEAQHVRALMHARGAKENRKVDTDFFRVLAEEGYEMPWARQFEIPVVLDCGCKTVWHEGATLYPYVYAWCETHGDAQVAEIIF